MSDWLILEQLVSLFHSLLYLNDLVLCFGLGEVGAIDCLLVVPDL